MHRIFLGTNGFHGLVGVCADAHHVCHRALFTQDQSRGHCASSHTCSGHWWRSLCASLVSCDVSYSSGLRDIHYVGHVCDNAPTRILAHHSMFCMDRNLLHASGRQYGRPQSGYSFCFDGRSVDDRMVTRMAKHHHLAGGLGRPRNPNPCVQPISHPESKSKAVY